jgi:hypothetical protein
MPALSPATLGRGNISASSRLFESAMTPASKVYDLDSPLALRLLSLAAAPTPTVAVLG